MGPHPARVAHPDLLYAGVGWAIDALFQRT
jgi:hypothetical protein